jgi:hypothetical protein
MSSFKGDFTETPILQTKRNEAGPKMLVYFERQLVKAQTFALMRTITNDILHNVGDFSLMPAAVHDL